MPCGHDENPHRAMALARSRPEGFLKALIRL